MPRTTSLAQQPNPDLPPDIAAKVKALQGPRYAYLDNIDTSVPYGKLDASGQPNPGLPPDIAAKVKALQGPRYAHLDNVDTSPYGNLDSSGRTNPDLPPDIAAKVKALQGPQYAYLDNVDTSYPSAYGNLNNSGQPNPGLPPDIAAKAQSLQGSRYAYLDNIDTSSPYGKLDASGQPNPDLPPDIAAKVKALQGPNYAYLDNADTSAPYAKSSPAVASPAGAPKLSQDDMLRTAMAKPNMSVRGPMEGHLYQPELGGQNASYEGYGRATGKAGTVFLKNDPSRARGFAQPSDAPVAQNGMPGLAGLAQSQGQPMVQDDLMRYHMQSQGGRTDMSGWTPQQRANANRPMPTAGSSASQDQLIKAQMEMSRDDRLMAHDDRLAQMANDREDKRDAAALAQKNMEYGRTRGDAKSDLAAERRLESIEKGIVAAAKKGDYNTATALEAARYSDVPIGQLIATAYAPDQLEKNAKTETVAAGLGTSLLFQQSVRRLQDLSNQAQGGKVDMAAVKKERDRLVQNLVAQGMEVDSANQYVRETVAKSLSNSGGEFESRWKGLWRLPGSAAPLGPSDVIDRLNNP